MVTDFDPLLLFSTRCCLQQGPFGVQKHLESFAEKMIDLVLAESLWIGLQAHDAPVTVMALDPSGGLLATASADRSVLVWDVDGGFCTHAFRGHKGIVTSVEFHPDPRRLLVSYI
jgi:WD40 repeat protein